ncbi:MAG: response regulator [Candidatus Pacearchaeota archaeon]|nr:response regulator [Candidatus Pacearchaeota archaeon]
MKEKEKKVLVVEDKPENIEAAKKYFDSQGIELDYAQTGEEALEKLEKNSDSYLFLVSDLSLPRKKGGEEELVGFEIGKKAEELGVPYLFATGIKMKGNHKIIPYEEFESEYRKYYKGNPEGDARIVGLNKALVDEWSKVYKTAEELGILEIAEESQRARARYKKFIGKKYKR